MKNGDAGWQLYYGEDFATSARYRPVIFHHLEASLFTNLLARKQKYASPPIYKSLEKL